MEKLNIPFDEKKYYAMDWFVYCITFLDLAAADIETGSLQIQSNSDFEWLAATYSCNLAGAAITEETRPIPMVNVLINDSATNSNLMSEPVSVPSIFGTGQFPYILQQTRIFPANSSLTFTVQNISAATEYDYLQLCLHGRKLFSKNR